MDFRGPIDFQVDKRSFKIYGVVPKSVIHSNRTLTEMNYRYLGGVHLGAILDVDQLVTVDANSYRMRHQTKNTVIKLRTSSYQAGPNTFSHKLAGVIRGRKLYIIVCRAKEFLSDIQDNLPLQVSGLHDLQKVIAHAHPEFKKQQELAV